MPVLAIEARGVDGNGQPDDDIETLIRHYIDRIRTPAAQRSIFPARTFIRRDGRFRDGATAPDNAGAHSLPNSAGYPRANKTVAASLLAGEFRFATARQSQADCEQLDQRERKLLYKEIDIALARFA